MALPAFFVYRYRFDLLHICFHRCAAIQKSHDHIQPWNMKGSLEYIAFQGGGGRIIVMQIAVPLAMGFIDEIFLTVFCRILI